jgi:hypothetical protein
MTPLAITLGHRATQAGIKMRFPSTADLPLTLDTATRQGHSGETLRWAVLVYRYLFFQVAAKHYEKGRLAVTSSLAFGRRDGAFTGDAALTGALLNRPLHHAHVAPIQGVLSSREQAQGRYPRPNGRATQLPGQWGAPDFNFHHTPAYSSFTLPSWLCCSGDRKHVLRAFLV